MTFYVGEPRTAQVAIGNPGTEPFNAHVDVRLDVNTVGESKVSRDVTVRPGGDTFTFQITPKHGGANVWEVDVYLPSGVQRYSDTFTVEAAGDNAPAAPDAPGNGMIILAGLCAAAAFVLSRKRK